MLNVIQIDPETLGGTPVFRGTRVPVETLFEYIEGHESVDEFLDDFPTVKREQIIELLEQLKTDAIGRTQAA